jgi:NAD(P)-dependent dehydrogenase (short-subunit alcohol dehydrogenase family)
MDWTGKTALITGGVSGIGFGIARAFCAAGIDLVLTWRYRTYRTQAESWFAEKGYPMPRFVELDVTDRAGWARVADHVGPLHILVNNAGVSVFGPDRRGQLRRLRLDHGRELRWRGQRPRYFRPAHQGTGTGRARRERGLDGGLSVGARRPASIRRASLPCVA